MINVLYDDLIEVMFNTSDKMVSRQGNKASPHKCSMKYDVGYTNDSCGT